MLSCCDRFVYLACDICGFVAPLKSDICQFELLGINKTFAIDPNALEDKFDVLQKEVHPDCNHKGDRLSLSEWSEFLNKTYDHMKTDYARGLLLLGQDPEKDISINDLTLLSEVMELQEEMYGLKDELAAAKFQAKLQFKKQATLDFLHSSFNDDEKITLSKLYYIRYLDKMLSNCFTGDGVSV